MRFLAFLLVFLAGVALGGGRGEAREPAPWLDAAPVPVVPVPGPYVDQEGMLHLKPEAVNSGPYYTPAIVSLRQNADGSWVMPEGPRWAPGISCLVDHRGAPCPGYGLQPVPAVQSEALQTWEAAVYTDELHVQQLNAGEARIYPLAVAGDSTITLSPDLTWEAWPYDSPESGVLYVQQGPAAEARVYGDFNMPETVRMRLTQEHD